MFSKKPPLPRLVLVTLLSVIMLSGCRLQFLGLGSSPFADGNQLYYVAVHTADFGSFHLIEDHLYSLNFVVPTYGEIAFAGSLDQFDEWYEANSQIYYNINPAIMSSRNPYVMLINLFDRHSNLVSFVVTDLPVPMGYEYFNPDDFTIIIATLDNINNYQGGI